MNETIDLKTRITLIEHRKSNIFSILESIIEKQIEAIKVLDNANLKISQCLNIKNQNSVICILKRKIKEIINKIININYLAKIFIKEYRDYQNSIKSECRALTEMLKEDSTKHIFTETDKYLRNKIYNGEIIKESTNKREDTNNILLIKNIKKLFTEKKSNELILTLINIRDLVICYKIECLNKGDNSFENVPLFECFDHKLEGQISKNNSILYKNMKFFI